ncbi:hypothetical protein PLESTB_000429100 [Pleodorina starrii]|uniref:Uncharacterized protein n=1 Tax=Pleodorina starrii TaxID=330485 RepID=A0A9W6BEV9_9CHLO|nr:hypothetical protein PLESTM_001694800 [Pleodorina starrii]GLC50763.1 hypothetical protein PLESTB_000429100 [Pleodorina starrii]GLC74329.1 hypothetical protein PLESTF_001500300 [Pleodorina starrii]
MSAIRQALVDQQERLRRQLAISVLLAQRQELPARFPPEADDNRAAEPPDPKVYSAYSQSAQRVLAHYKRLHPTACWLAGHGRQGQSRRPRRPLPWAAGGRTPTRHRGGRGASDEEKSEGDSATAPASRAAAAAAAMPALGSARHAASRRPPPPPQYSTLLPPMPGAPPIVPACIRSAAKIGLLDSHYVSRARTSVRATQIHLGLCAVQLVRPSLPSGWAPSGGVPTAFSELRQRAMAFAKSQEALDAAAATLPEGTAIWVGAPDKDKDKDKLRLAFLPRWRELRRGYLAEGREAWQRLETTLQAQPALRAFAFGEAACTVPEPQLREALQALRPQLRADAWRRLQVMASIPNDAGAPVVLDLAVRGLVLLDGSGVPDSRLDPLACAALTLLLALLRMSTSQLRSVDRSLVQRGGEARSHLLAAVASLRAALRAAGLTGKPYKYLSPAQLYDIVCWTPVPSDGGGGGGGGDGSSGRSRGAPAGPPRGEEQQRYSPAHFAAMLAASSPGMFVQSLAEAAMIKAASRDGPTDIELTEAMSNVLAAQVCGDAHDERAAERRVGAGFGAATGGLGAGFGIGAPIGAPALGRRGLYEFLYELGLYGGEALAGAALDGNDDDGGGSGDGGGEPEVLRRDVLRSVCFYMGCLESYGCVSYGEPEHDDDDPRNVGVLRELLRFGAAAAAGSGGGGGAQTRRQQQSGGERARLFDAMGFGDVLQRALHRSSNSSAVSQLLGWIEDGERVSLRYMAEELRPGLLAAHRGSWEGLLMRAEEERARSCGGLDASAAFETAQVALMGLAALKGQELPMHLFGLPYCIMTGVVLYRELSKTGRAGAPAPPLPPLVASNLLFRWLHFVPRFWLLVPEEGWLGAPVARQRTAAAAAAAAEPLPSPGHRLRRSLERLVRSLGAFLALPPPYVTLLTAYCSRCGLDRWRQRGWQPDQPWELWPQRGWQESGARAGSMSGLVCHWGTLCLAWGASRRVWAEGGLSSDDDGEGYDDGYDSWDDSWDEAFFEDSGDDEEEFAAATAAAAAAAAAGPVEVEVEVLPPRQQRQHQQQQHGRAGERWWERGERAGPEAGSGAGFGHAADGRVHVSTRRLAGAKAEGGAAAAEPASRQTPSHHPPGGAGASGLGDSSRTARVGLATASGGSAKDGSGARQRTGSDSGDGGDGGGGGGGGGGGALALHPGCALEQLLPVMEMCDQVCVFSSVGETGGRRRRGGNSVDVQGPEAAALLVLLLAHPAVTRKQMDALFQLGQDGDEGAAAAGGAAGAAAAGGAAGAAAAAGAATAAAAAAAASSGAKGKKGRAHAQAPAAGAVGAGGRSGSGPSGCGSAAAAAARRGEEEVSELRLRLSVHRGHLRHALYDLVDVPTGRSAEPQRVTITATSKLAQQTKLVRKALVEQQARVFELRAQGVEGLQRALRLVQQVCRDMRAQQRDLFIQPTNLYFAADEEEDVDDDKAGARQQRQPRKGSETGYRLREAMDELLQGRDMFITSRGLYDGGGGGGWTSGDYMCSMGRARYALKFLWEQLRGAGAGGGGGSGGGGSGGSGGGSGGGPALQELCYVLLVVECERGRPAELARKRGEESAQSARKELTRTMMSSV